MDTGLIIAGVLGVGLFLIGKMRDYKALVDNLDFDVKVEKAKIQKTNLILWLKIKFINPSQAEASFSNPSVTISYNDSQICKSRINTNKYTIKSLSTTEMTLKFNISLISNLIVFISLFRELLKNTTINLSNISTVLASNLDEVLKKLECKVLIYFEGQPIEYKTKLA